MSSQISNAVTYISRHPHSLLSVLPQALQRTHSPAAPSPDQTLLFAIAPSSTTPPEVLSDITSALTQFCPQHVGCIAAPLPHQYFSSRIHRGPDSCSLSLAFVNGIPFRSTIPGRAEAQVGRWHAARRRSIADDKLVHEKEVSEDIQSRILRDPSRFEGRIDWDKVWERSANAKTFLSSSFDTQPDIESLPDTLQNVDPSVIDNILYFSDKSPEGIGSALEGRFPQANKLALVASSTPFLTGRPVTLFHNGSILSHGAIGIAFTRCTPSPPAMELSFPPLLALSPNLKVTSSEGNLILSLDSGNPAQLLLDAIQKHGVSSSTTAWIGKEDEFYVGNIDPSNQEIVQLHRINSGDPSRGTIALDTNSAPRQDTTICLYHRSRHLSPGAHTYIPDSSHSSLSLFVAPETHPKGSSEQTKESDSPSLSNDLSVISNAFLVASENGFTMSRLEGGQYSTHGPWKCVVPGGRAGLSWKSL